MRMERRSVILHLSFYNVISLNKTPLKSFLFLVKNKNSFYKENDLAVLLYFPEEHVRTSP